MDFLLILRKLFKMALNFSKVPNSLFSNTREEDIGISGKGGNVTTVTEKSFVVGGVANQFDCTAAFTDVFSVEHESKTGRVLVLFTAETAPGVSHWITTKLQKDGVDVEGQQIESYVNAKPGTEYYSINPANYIASSPDTDNISMTWGKILFSATASCYAPVNLPHGATVTNVIVYGSEADESWTLTRATDHSAGVATMATAAYGTADSTITNPVIDNANYSYAIGTGSMDATDEIYSGVISYETSPYSHQGEGPTLPIAIHHVGIAEKNTWKIQAKVNEVALADSFINDRTFSIIDI